ncbi:hypothetical protein [Flagellimonas onchidii]|uniref:hypothetical protein n=1 Tax=Flagellimonas onchidii TaxID=2562684 RepID=UPI0010A5D5D7|nr:hypothetical protein [Allomuricauda onchidii]
MIHYFIEVIFFQFLFLIPYFLFFKKETFFNLNRFYLLLTYIFSIILPLFEFEIFNLSISKSNFPYSNIFIELTSVSNEILILPKDSYTLIRFEHFVIIGGISFTSILLLLKLKRISNIRKKCKPEVFDDYTLYILPESTTAFSFLNSIYIGDKIPREVRKKIVEHELIHINQKHTFDLLFFELMKIVFCLSPLTYVYQSKILEVHEFIVDSKLGRTNKKEHLLFLLSQAFHTDNLSLINHFSKDSIIKKRLLMLSKTKSSKSKKLIYLVVIPLMFGMLSYTSTDFDEAFIKTNLSNQKNQTKEIPFLLANQVPIFPGCKNSSNPVECFNMKMNEHIERNVNYALTNDKSVIGQSIVRVLCTIDKNGMVKNIKVRGSSRILEEESYRIISILPDMEPGFYMEKKIDVLFSTLIDFSVFKMKV